MEVVNTYGITYIYMKDKFHGWIAKIEPGVGISFGGIIKFKDAKELFDRILKEMHPIEYQIIKTFLEEPAFVEFYSGKVESLKKSDVKIV